MALLIFFLIGLQIADSHPISDQINTFAQALISAPTDQERNSLLQQNKNLIGVPLREALLKEASALILKGEYSRAELVCQLALQISNSIKDQKGIAAALNIRGRVYLEQEKYDEALKILEEALEISRAISDQEESAQALRNIGLFHYDQQNYEEALRYYGQSLDLYKKLNNDKEQAKTLNMIANAYDYQWNPKKALEFYEKSLKLSEQAHDDVGAAGVYVNMGTVLNDMGLNDMAMQNYRKAEKVYEAAGEKPNLGVVLNNMGNTLSDTGNYRLALQYHLKALKLREELGRARGVCGSQINIGYIHEKQGNYDLSLNFYLQAYEIAKKADDKYLQSIALGNVGGIYSLTGEYKTALDYFKKTQALREQMGDQPGIAAVFYPIAATYEFMEEFEKADEYYLKALSLFKESNIVGRAIECLLGLSTVHFKQKHFEEAERFADEAYQLIQRAELPDLIWPVLTQKARILINKGETQKSEAILRESIDRVESLRQQVVGGETASQQFFALRQEPFYLMVELLVQQNRNAEAFHYAERIRARVLLDVLQSGRIELTKHMSSAETTKERDLKTELMISNASLRKEKEKEKPDSVRIKELASQIQNTRMSLEAFQANLYANHPFLKMQRAEIPSINAEKIGSLLSTEEAILEYSVSEDQSFLFVWTRSQSNEKPALNVIQIPVKRKALAEMTKTYRQKLGKRDLRVTGLQLYNLLMKPVEKQLAGKTSIVIVPDRELWDLPFQALQTENGRIVLEQFSISYAPSASVLYEMKKTRKGTGRSSVLLALASSIPEAETEVNALAQLYGKEKSRVYTGKQAKESTLKSEASKFEIIHVATHGVMNNSSPMYSFLSLSNDEREDGLLEPWEVLNLELNPALVVLSSCESGGGKIGAGEGIIGFTWAFFVAGSPSTVASQWKVDSESTVALMLEFHRNLKIKKLSKSEALRQAALKLRQDPKYRHPYYWAGFIVVGDPSPI